MLNGITMTNDLDYGDVWGKSHVCVINKQRLNMKKSLFILAPMLLILSGCSTSNQYYSDELVPIYYEWYGKSFGDASNNWLNQKTERIGASMRKDGYDGAEIGAIKDAARDRAFKILEWQKGQGPCPTDEKYIDNPSKLILRG
jgi:hypothetical protein